MPYLEAAARLLGPCDNILVFTGAGISTESGIPDFRGPDGVWTRVDPAEFTIDRFLTRAETRMKSWEMRFAPGGVLDAAPNAAHGAVARLWESGRAIGCVTQNIDGLHLAAGMPPEALVEIHGSANGVRCLTCGDRQPVENLRSRFDAGERDMTCHLCGGILKSTVISFGEEMPAEEMDRAFSWAAAADAVLAIGSTLSVFPAAYVPLQVAEAGHPFVIINIGPTDMDSIATLRLEGPAGTVVPELVDLLVGA